MSSKLLFFIADLVCLDRKKKGLEAGSFCELNSEPLHSVSKLLFLPDVRLIKTLFRVLK